MPPATPNKNLAPLSPAIESGRRVLAIEISAMQSLAASLGDDFTRAVETLGNLGVGTGRGRVITTGMGKSGHVAHKLAATLSSTGTPSVFIHAAEAGHGDLGMLMEGDAVLAFSNSGETRELTAIVEDTRRRRIPLVGITARAKSALARTADVALVLPAFEEACPMGLAPTTSTTLQTALGDALAVALLEARGFEAKDFHALHPSGNLGQLLTRVDTLMHPRDAVPLARPSDLMQECILKMTGSGFGCVGIVEESGRLIGVITDGDLRRHMEPQLLERRAEDVMSRSPFSVSPETLVSVALLAMEEHKVSAIFVVESERPIGLVRLLDLLARKVA